ncbi:MAG: hypothetical protein EOP58_13360 [Sphingomonadales bacterium]|nr:MAG: hypothetical protein EOP58_13360 [Sphingomonadales bacterium]
MGAAALLMLAACDPGPVKTKADHAQDARDPDGGFHRLRVTRDGRGVIAADGASAASVTIIDKDAIEVAIDDARYRLPATVKGAARK